MEGEREARLDRDEFTRLLRLVDAAEELEHGYETEEYDTYVERLLAHDAVQRSRIEELKRAIKSTNKLLAFVARHPDSSPGLDVDTVREQWEYNQRVLQGGSDGSDG